MPKGFVYILVSPNSSYVKIGGTEHPISKRLKEINATPAYGEHGPWELSDFLQVTDWRVVERRLHQHFQRSQVLDVLAARELFRLPPHEARTQLRLTDPSLRIGHAKTRELFQNHDLKLFLFRLFQLSGLFGYMDIQGAWTLSVLTSTLGGRWFTINIGPHEVAFSARSRVGNPFHHLVVDRLILDYRETTKWIRKRGGQIAPASYKTARERAVAISFEDDFASAERIFALRGIRRALVAYWSDVLADLRERSVKSTYARYHSYDAASDLYDYRRAVENSFNVSIKPEDLAR